MNEEPQDSLRSSKSESSSYRVWSGQSYSKQHLVQTPYGPCYFSVEQSVRPGFHHYPSYVAVAVDEATTSTSTWIAEKSSK
jgi:hypothetical protein